MAGAVAFAAFVTAYGLTKLAASGPPGMRWVPSGEFTTGSDA